MTNPSDAGSGPSLVQARSTTDTRHNVNRDLHHHNHNHHHLHLHQHRRLHSHAQSRQPQGAGDAAPHIRSSQPSTEKQLHERGEVVIVQTVSVIHYIDGSGAVTSTSTVRSDPDPAFVVAPPPPALVDPAAVTAGLSSLVDALPSVSLSGLIPDFTDGAPSTTASAEPEPSLALTLSASSETLTSAPFTSSSAFPTLSASNSSSSAFPTLFNNGTVGLYSNRTRTSLSHSTFASTKTTSKSSKTSVRLTSTTTSSDSTPSALVGGAADGANAPAGIPAPAATATDSEPESGGSGLPPETRNAVVGGVVGSVAGIALVALGLLFFLKWRKQRGRGIMLLGDGDSTARSRGGLFGGYGTSGGPSNSGGGGGGGGGSGGMTERSGAFAIPAALAKLSGGGNKRAIEAPPEPSPPQEKGFYRVSGRKLISVLESGGDGYSDPHDSIGSGGSSYHYRDSRAYSQAFLDDPTHPPLQLGSPMRPVSGVMIMRDGPQRTPVEEHGPLPPGHRPSAFPALLPLPDPVGRSLAGRDGSRGSRFTEDA